VEIPPEIANSMANIFQYAPQINEWIVLKRELLNSIPSKLRSLFSTRHPLTKRTQTNEFELALAHRWAELTGRPVLFKDDEGKAGPTTPT
jgi:hypothetical protein